MAYKIKIEPEAHEDIQQGIDWYNEKQLGLGRKFHKEVKDSINRLKENPFFQVSYKNVHCLPLKNYPYMLHFTINKKDKIVVVRAVFNTSRNPDIWKKR